VTPVPGLLAEAWGFCTAGSEDAYAPNLLLFLGSLFVCSCWVYMCGWGWGVGGGVSEDGEGEIIGMMAGNDMHWPDQSMFPKKRKFSSAMLEESYLIPLASRSNSCEWVRMCG
jgi:hypothetical protein